MKTLQASWDIPHESGAVVRHFSIHSEILQGSSKAGFPARRTHTAFIPSECIAGQKAPILYLFAPWTSAGRTMFNWEPFREDLASRLSRLISSKQIPPCIVVCPDLFVDFGGSQYINSSWIGNHADHIVNELIPFVENQFPVLKGVQHRAALGRSSGGFGALRFAMDYDESFAAIACHAGDMGFEWVYRRSLIDICTGLTKFQDPVIYMTELRKQKKLTGFDTHVLMMLGMCAFYSPNPDTHAGFDLPISLRNGEIIEPIWAKWMSHDPLERIKSSIVQERLGKLKRLFIDCGNRDQYFLQYGARQLNAKLKTLGISHTYGEYDDNHSGTAYRFDESLPQLLSVLV
jgi:enterochelin esterase-like enzyme